MFGSAPECCRFRTRLLSCSCRMFSLVSVLQLCHRLVDGLCGREPPCRGEYGATWGLQEWAGLRDSLTALFCRAVGSNSADEEVTGKTIFIHIF